jgi:hypothetical protein
VTGKLTIQLKDDLLDDAYIRISDAHGKSILKETIRRREHRIDLGNIPEWIYIISITAKQGSVVRKFIKE